jgi:hypothetical protein
MPNNSKGCIIAALNTVELNYIGLSKQAADRVVKYLGLPVTIITDNPNADFGKHNVVAVDKPIDNRRTPFGKQNQQWFNLVRTQVYDLSPYDRTLLIDGDYFICTDALLPHVNCNADFIMAKEIYNPTNGNIEIYKLGNTAIEQYWATVCIFNKCRESANIFEMAKHVQKHYRYYSELYRFAPRPLRNDYIFSIACHLIGGYGMKDYGFKSYPLINCNDQIDYESFENNKLIYRYIKDGVYSNRFINTDLHLMNKDQI